MIESTEGLLMLIAATAGVAVVHTLLGPDHYLPFVAMSRARRWSLGKTIGVTLACGMGHVLASVVLATVGIAVGLTVFQLETVNTARGDLAAWMLLAFGAAYFVWGVRRAMRSRRHTHWHVHADGIVHCHEHDHTGEHVHVHESGPESEAAAEPPGKKTEAPNQATGSKPSTSPRDVKVKQQATRSGDSAHRGFVADQNRSSDSAQPLGRQQKDSAGAAIIESESTRNAVHGAAASARTEAHGSPRSPDFAVQTSPKIGGAQWADASAAGADAVAKLPALSLTPWVLFTIFIFGPCESLLPILMYAAARSTLWGVALVVLVFAAATLTAMTAAVLVGCRVTAGIGLGRLEYYNHAAAGFVLLVCGAAILVGL